MSANNRIIPSLQADGVSIVWMKETDSTNLQAARCMEESKDKSVWAAEFQTQGRGQRGNKWESARGKNLTFSILLKPHLITAGEQFVISQFVTIGIADYLKSNGVDAKIKWPNDIYVGDKKICGILIENSVTGDKLSASIIGIGLNLNQTEFASDAPNPTSLLLEKKRVTGQEQYPPFDLQNELLSLLDHILYLYNQETIPFEKIDSLYHQRLYRLGVLTSYKDNLTNEIVTGKIIGVNNLACLVLELENGEKRTYSFKEIEYIF